jgi:hypothetical protein
MAAAAETAAAAAAAAAAPWHQQQQSGIADNMTLSESIEMLATSTRHKDISPTLDMIL